MLAEVLRKGTLCDERRKESTLTSRPEDEERQEKRKRKEDKDERHESCGLSQTETQNEK
jgi:hypothetical protein